MILASWRGGEAQAIELTNLAIDLRCLGEHRAARELDHYTLARLRRVLGEDYADTLTSTSNLAAALRALGNASLNMPITSRMTSRSA